MKGMIGPSFPCTECQEPMGMTKKGHINYRTFTVCRKCNTNNIDNLVFQVILHSGTLD